MDKKQVSCPAELALKALSGRWKLLILRELRNGPVRPNELERALKGITRKILTQQLRQMEDQGIVERKIYPEVPPRVEYFLTPLGRSLTPIVEAMEAWGIRYSQQKKPPLP